MNDETEFILGLAAAVLWLACILICFLKGKPWIAIIGIIGVAVPCVYSKADGPWYIFVPFFCILILATLDIGKPESLWAKWVYGPKKMARAVDRSQPTKKRRQLALATALLALGLMPVLVKYALYALIKREVPVGSAPEYLWPPPYASDSAVTVPAWLKKCATLDEAYQEIRNSLQKAEYQNVGLYSLAPTGFMVVTEPERIRSDGSTGNDRWKITRQAGNSEQHIQVSFDRVKGYFNAAPEGLYRFFIFAVTSNPPDPHTEHTPHWVRDSKLSKVGDFSNLPPELRNISLSDEYRLHAYLYCWRREELERLPHFSESDIGIRQHLKGARLDDLLNSRP